jgi:hypothetical protein
MSAAAGPSTAATTAADWARPKLPPDHTVPPTTPATPFARHHRLELVELDLGLGEIEV